MENGGNPPSAAPLRKAEPKSTLILKPNIVEGQVFLTRHFLLPVDAANVEKGVAEFYNIGPDMIYSLYYNYQNKLHAVSFQIGRAHV